MTHVKVILRGISTVRCYLPVNSIACCQFLPANLSNISSNSKLHLYARGKSNALPLLNLLLDQIQEHPRTTFADVKPIEVDSVLANQVANILKQDSCEINEQTNDSVGNFKFDPHLSKNVFHYPIAKDIQQSQSSSKTFVTMTYAGKRYYSTDKPSSKTSSDANKDDDAKDDLSNEDGVPASKTQQLKRIFAIYGTFGMVFHIVMSLASLGIVYLIVSSGIDVVGILGKMGIELSSVAGGASTMVIAYAVHKLILPLRATITIVSVPVLVRYLRRAGYLKK